MSDYETLQRRRNIVVGIFVVVAACALIWLVFKFGDLPTIVSRARSFQVFVQFPRAPGVQKDTPVRFCGYQIGRVTKVKAPEVRKDLVTGLEYHQTVAVLSIDKKYINIPSNVDVKLMTRGLGSSYIELSVDPALPLIQRDPNRPETVYLVQEMWLQGSTGMTSEFFPEESQKKLSEMVDSLRTLIKNANDIIGDQANQQNLSSILANLTEATKQATGTFKEFKEFCEAGTVTLENADERLEKLSVAMVDISEELNQTLKQLRLILEKVNSGEGTVARLVNDGKVYESLLESTQQMQMLLQEMQSLVDKNKALPIKLK